MKHPAKLLMLKPFFVTLFASLFSLMVCAQNDQGSSESSTTTTTTEKTSTSVTAGTNSNAWYTSPWVWIVGAAVFILLLVALLSNRGHDTVTTSDRVQVTKTVERDRGTDV